MIQHSVRGKLIIDAIGKKVLHSEDPELAEFVSELLGFLAEAALPQQSHGGCGHKH